MDKKLAESTTTEPDFGTRTWQFEVADEMVEDLVDWSEPMRIKIERGEDGRCTMLLRWPE